MRPFVGSRCSAPTSTASSRFLAPRGAPTALRARDREEDAANKQRPPPPIHRVGRRVEYGYRSAPTRRAPRRRRAEILWLLR